MQQIGLVGRGFMATVNAVRYESLPGCEVTAVASRSPPTEFVERYAPDADAYGDVETMFDKAELDAVDLCTPTDTHRNLVASAVDRGLAVRCEKPLERTVADAEATADVVKSADVPFLPGHVVRFFPEYDKARSRIAEGVIGDVGKVRTFRQSPVVGLSDWFGDRNRSGGVLMDLGVHDFDFLRWVCGDVERVYANRSTWDGNEYSLTTLRFANGTVGHVDLRWPASTEVPFVTRFEFAGTDGLIEFDSTDSNSIDVRSLGSDGGPDRDPIDIPLAKDPYYRQLEHFRDCITGEADPKVTIDDAVAAVRIATAALESAKTGSPVAIDDTEKSGSVTPGRGGDGR
ncbi:Gfo/Idh/MocA family protein [Halorussus salinisoli]|uniref:Gfo/Idh/MocA family protein n=1 Tax=Halorussus salinisoli TaxID=2558242 RepID=UPI0010C20026|nr:Gfo/Idh/MocA family oxidoreductase [Halorussus salinisoli]